MAEPESLVLEILRGLRKDLGDVKNDIRENLATKEDISSLRSEMNSLRADVASDLLLAREESRSMQKETREQIVGLRRAVIEYHSTVVGHGMIISELEERMRRVEQHLNLPAIGSH